MHYTKEEVKRKINEIKEEINRYFGLIEQCIKDAEGKSETVVNYYRGKAGVYLEYIQEELYEEKAHYEQLLRAIEEQEELELLRRQRKNPNTVTEIKTFDAWLAKQVAEEKRNKQKPKLNDLLRQINDENRHPEIDFGIMGEEKI